MKYIIPENRLVQVIENYIDFELGRFKKKTVYIPDGGIFNLKRKKVVLFVDENNNTIMELEKTGLLGVEHKYWLRISEMFSLDYPETYIVIKNWFKKRYGVEKVKPYWKW